MTNQERVLGLAVPEQRGTGVDGRAERAPGTGPRLRVDARRNLESVLRAAREVFGEQGYGAPMEEVARRAGVGVGTVYRRFPSKEVLVQRIAAEEVGWLTKQARESLYGGDGPWESLAGYLVRAVGSGAGRLLPPEAFRYAEELGRTPDAVVPEQRRPVGPPEPGGEEADPRMLLHLLAALVNRAAAAGELRPGVTVADVVLVLTASVPLHVTASVQPAGTADGAERAGSAQPGSPVTGRLLEILLQGMRA